MVGEPVKLYKRKKNNIGALQVLESELQVLGVSTIWYRDANGNARGTL